MWHTSWTATSICCLAGNHASSCKTLWRRARQPDSAPHGDDPKPHTKSLFATTISVIHWKYLTSIFSFFFFFLVPLQVSIVFSLFRLCSAAEKPVLPYYTKAAVISAVRTVVDGFLEMWVFSQYRLISVSAHGWLSQSCQFYLCAELLHFQNCSMHKKSISSRSGPRSDLHSFAIAFNGLVGLVVLMSSHLPFHSVYFCFGRSCGCRDQLSQEEGVVDKMQVFRPDRVFMVQKKIYPSSHDSISDFGQKP